MKKILVIDDAEFILESTATLLGFEGYDVVTACDGVEGVAAALEHQPDLILCDISMPNLDGYGVIEQLRKNEKTVTTPFIFLTAFTEKSNMRMGMEKGADDFLVKPYTREELISAIDAQWKKSSNIEKVVQDKVEIVGQNVSYALPHEFRTVINQVMGSARFLLSNPDTITPDEITELASDVLSSAQRLLKITENFLIYTRIESIATNIERKRLLRTMRTDEPGAMIYDVASMIAEKAGRMDDLQIGDIVDSITLEASTETFHKIIDELFDNAFKFSPEGTPVEISTHVENNMMYLVIKDQGRGFTKDQIGNIGAYVQFERTKYEQQGVGLGLVIAKRFVELHDGVFQLESEENKGSKITLSLPYLMMS